LDALVELSELVLGGGEADSQSFGFAEPALLFGFGDASGEVVADLLQPRPLGRVDAEEGALTQECSCWQLVP
jgi:hypothetical protein